MLGEGAVLRVYGGRGGGCVCGGGDGRGPGGEVLARAQVDWQTDCDGAGFRWQQHHLFSFPPVSLHPPLLSPPPPPPPPTHTHTRRRQPDTGPSFKAVGGQTNMLQSMNVNGIRCGYFPSFLFSSSLLHLLFFLRVMSVELDGI